MSDVPSQPGGFSRDEQVRLLRVVSMPFAVCLLFFFVTPTAVQPLRPSTGDTRQQIIGVVESQFTAFRDGDYARAYSFAAAAIQHQFTVAAFERMVKDGYPVIAYWRAVRFGDVADNGREAMVLVSVQGRGGRTRFFRYLLIREANLWRINGVMEINPLPTVPGQMV